MTSGVTAPDLRCDRAVIRTGAGGSGLGQALIGTAASGVATWKLKLSSR